MNPLRSVFSLILLGSAIQLAACDREPLTLRLVAPSSNLDAAIVNDLAATLDDGSEFRLEVSRAQETGERALDMILAGEADIALVSNYLPYRERISTIMPVYPSVLHIAHRADLDADDGAAMFSGARIFSGAQGSASRLIFERIADRINLTPDQYSFVAEVDGPDATEPDIAVVFAPISPRLAEELSGYRLFSFGTPQDIGKGSIVDAATLLNPPLRPFVIPAGTYGPVNASPVVTVAVDKILVARSDLDRSLVYDLINAIRRARPALSASRPGLFEQLDASFDVSNSTFVLHSGTQDFLQRDEPTIYERYSGVAEVVVTLIIGLVSASFAMFKIFKIRRKNRIDEYYSAALSIRKQLGAGDDDAAVQQLRQQLRELQDKAFAELVDEKLAADESFRIFMSLSNDILDQTEKR